MRLHHVSIPAPSNAIEASRDFYGRLLGLPEITPPETLETGSVIWFQAGESELHLFKEDMDSSQASGRHFCFAVDDLDAIRGRMEAAGIETEDTTPIHNRPRFFCTDPFGNRLELTELRGPYR